MTIILDPSTTKTTPVTLNEAVNILLRAIGKAGVMALTPESMDQAAYDALACLNDASVEVQSQGWHFNREEEYPVPPEPDGSIPIPASWTHVKLSAKSAQDMRCTVRDGRLYDKLKRSYTSFTSTVYLDFTEVFPFEDTPAHVRQYIVARAGRAFGPGRAPDSLTYRFTKDFEDIAQSEALQRDDEEHGNSLAETSPHFISMRRR